MCTICSQICYFPLTKKKDSKDSVGFDFDFIHYKQSARFLFSLEGFCAERACSISLFGAIFNSCRIELSFGGGQTCFDMTNIIP